MTRLKNKPLRLLQITDTHLGKDPSDTLLGLNTEQSMRDVLEEVRDAQRHYDLIVCSGDISCDGSIESYDRFISIVNEFLPGVPLAWLEGNHDDPVSMRAISQPKPLTEAVSLGPWQIILLNSRVDGEVGGALAQSELDRLEQLLKTRANSPTAVFLHHQPVPVGCKWIDQYVVSNADAMFSVLERFECVKSVCWGHVHQVFEAQRKHMTLLASPSTCVQFLPNSANFAVDQNMPGYREFLLHDDGRYETSVYRVSERAYPIDFASSGY